MSQRLPGKPKARLTIKGGFVRLEVGNLEQPFYLDEKGNLGGLSRANGFLDDEQAVRWARKVGYEAERRSTR